MDGNIREQVEALRREIAEIQKLNLAFLQMPDRLYERREQRLKEIMAELKIHDGVEANLNGLIPLVAEHESLTLSEPLS